MIRIAYCIPKPYIGGAELHLLEVLRNIDQRRFEPIMVFLSDGRCEEELYRDFEALDIQLVNLGMLSKTFCRENYKKILQLAKVFRENRVDIVHGYLLEGNLIGALSGRLAGVPVCITSKRSLEQHNRFQLLASKLSNWLSTRVTAVSQAVGEFACIAEGCPQRKIIVIPNGVHMESASFSTLGTAELKRQWGIPEDNLVVGTVARFSWKKGYQYFVETAAAVLKENPKVHFVAFGDGPLRQEIEEMAIRLGIASNIVFAGWQSDTRSKMPLFDIYICTSVIEGMSNALLDAMAQRRPILATAVGGNMENVIDGVTGYLVPPRDSSAMAARIIKLAANPDLLKRMGEAGQRRVSEEYTVGRMIARMEDLYSALLIEKSVMQKSNS